MVLNTSLNENEPMVCTLRLARPAYGSERSRSVIPRMS